MEGIQVSVEKTGSQGDISIIRVGGYIDTTTSAELERALDALLKAGIIHVIIDLKNVDYISSAGWGIFISEIKGIRERGGDLKLARMIPDVYEVFELLEFHYILKSFDSIEMAIQDFNGGSIDSIIEDEPAPKKAPRIKEEVIQEANVPVEPSPTQVDASIEEKVRLIALEHTDWNPGQIAKELNTDRFGYVRIGKIAVWKLLRKMHLSGKKHREAVTKGSPF